MSSCTPFFFIACCCNTLAWEGKRSFKLRFFFVRFVPFVIEVGAFALCLNQVGHVLEKDQLKSVALWLLNPFMTIKFLVH